MPSKTPTERLVDVIKGGKPAALGGVPCMVCGKVGRWQFLDVERDEEGLHVNFKCECRRCAASLDKDNDGEWFIVQVMKVNAQRALELSREMRRCDVIDFPEC